MSKGKIGGIILAGMLVLAGAGLVFCSERIPAGYVGVVYNMNGGIQEETLSQGWHLVPPTKHITKYSIAIEQGYLSKDKQEGSPDDDSFKIPTSDGKTIDVDMEYSYHFDSENISTVFTQFKGQSGEQIEKTFIRGKLKSWAGEVSCKFPVTDIFGDKRTELNEATKEHVAEKFKPYGIIIDSVSFPRIETDPDTEAAIQQKVNAQQELELAKIEAETAQVQANKDKEVAIIAAQKDKETAQLKAEAKMIEAEAEAKANKEIAASLTPELIEQKKYEKWDGKLPTISGANGTIIDYNSISGK